MGLQRRLIEARSAWIVCALLVLGTLGIYWQVSGFEFLSYDDNEYVTGNALVRAGLTWPGIAWAFTSGNGGCFVWVFAQAAKTAMLARL